MIYRISLSHPQIAKTLYYIIESLMGLLVKLKNDYVLYSRRDFTAEIFSIYILRCIDPLFFP